MLCKHQIVLPDDVVIANGLEGNIVCKSILEKLCDYQDGKQLKMAPNLVRDKISPAHFAKMNVASALHLFSNSVRAALKLMADTGNLSADEKAICSATSWFVLQVDRWFSLMSSRSIVMALSHHNEQQYQDSIHFLQSFSDMITDCKFGERGDWKPVQSGILLSTTSIVELASELVGNRHLYLLTGRLTQDCLENLFSTVRLKNPLPTPREFRSALKASLSFDCISFT
jgi:hypothetical protein